MRQYETVEESSNSVSSESVVFVWQLCMPCPGSAHHCMCGIRQATSTPVYKDDASIPTSQDCIRYQRQNINIHKYSLNVPLLLSFPIRPEEFESTRHEQSGKGASLQHFPRLQKISFLASYCQLLVLKYILGRLNIVYRCFTLQNVKRSSYKL